MALSSFDAALALEKDHSVGQRLRAETLFRLGRFEEVIAAFDRYLETGKPLESVYRGRGLARAELGQYPGAIEDFTKALELHPTSEVQAYRGWTYLVTDAPKLALRDFELAVELDPKNARRVKRPRIRPREARPILRGRSGCRGGAPPGSDLAALAVQRREDLRAVPRRLPATIARFDRESTRLASRGGTSRLLDDAHSIGCGPGRAAAASVVRQAIRRATPGN